MARMSFTELMVGLSLVFSAEVYAQSWKIEPEQSPVDFVAKATPGFLTIKGRKAKLAGAAEVKDGKLLGNFEVNLNDLTTDLSMRDDHMKNNYLEIQKFPKATLSLDPIDLSGANALREQKFSGTLTVKGEKKVVEGILNIDSLDSATAKGDATFKISLSDFPAIGAPKHLGVVVGENIVINIAFVGTKT